MSAFFNIGYGNLVSGDRIVAVLSPTAAPVKRLVGQALEAGLLLDASCGKKTESVIVTDCKFVVLSALTPSAIEAILNSHENAQNS